MRSVSVSALIVLVIGLGIGCGGADRGLESRLGLGDPTVAWSSLGMSGIAFSLTNRTDRDFILTDLELLVDERIPEELPGDSLTCPGTKVEFGDLFFNISRDSSDHTLKVFSPVGGGAPTTELTVAAGQTRDLEVLVFNHLQTGEGGREVDACRIRVRVGLDGASLTSRPVEIHFNTVDQ